MCGVESSRMPVSTYMASLIWRFAGSQCSFSSSVVSILFLVNDDSYQLNAGILLAMGHASFRCSFWFGNCARSHWYYSWTSILFLGCVASACHWAKHIEDATMVVSFKCWWCHIRFNKLHFLSFSACAHSSTSILHTHTSTPVRHIELSSDEENKTVKLYHHIFLLWLRDCCILDLIDYHGCNTVLKKKIYISIS